MCFSLHKIKQNKIQHQAAKVLILQPVQKVKTR